MGNLGGDESGSIDLQEALDRLAEAERITTVLEARLVRYQSALENIKAAAGEALEG